MILCVGFFFFFLYKRVAVDSGLGRAALGKDACRGPSFPAEHVPQGLVHGADLGFGPLSYVGVRLEDSHHIDTPPWPSWLPMSVGSHWWCDLSRAVSWRVVTRWTTSTNMPTVTSSYRHENQDLASPICNWKVAVRPGLRSLDSQRLYSDHTCCHVCKHPRLPLTWCFDL